MTENNHHAPDSPGPSRRLEGWDAIGGYLGVTARTAQNWRRNRALPVHYYAGRRGGRAFAYVSELDLWCRYGSEKPKTSLGVFPPLISSVLRSPAFIISAGTILFLGILLVASAWYAENHITPPRLKRFSIVKTYDGPPRPEGTWSFRALAFDGQFLWSAITQEGYASRLCKHRVDDRLGVVECYDLLTAYITSVGFHGSEMWSVDNYHDSFLKLGSPPSIMLENYPIAGRDSPNSIAIVGESLWAVYSKSIDRFAIPPKRKIETIPILGVNDCGIWDGNSLWILDGEQRTIRRYKLDPRVAMVGIYRLPAELDSASSQLWGGCFVNGYLWLAENNQYRIYQLGLPD